MAEQPNDGGAGRLITLPAVVGLVLAALSVPGFLVLRRIVGDRQTASSQLAERHDPPASSQQPAKASPSSDALPAARSSTPTPSTAVPRPAGPVAAAPKVPTATFKSVKLLVGQGDKLRERDAVLQLHGDHLSVLDSSGKAKLLTLPYRSIVQIFHSRSKQPRWKRSTATEEVARVDLGRMRIFRGERNWVILTTRSRPVILAFEDSDLRTALPLVEERIGIRIVR